MVERFDYCGWAPALSFTFSHIWTNDHDCAWHAELAPLPGFGWLQPHFYFAGALAKLNVPRSRTLALFLLLRRRILVFGNNKARIFSFAL